MRDPRFLLHELKKRLLLPPNEIREAERGWRRTSQAIRTGLSFNSGEDIERRNYSELRDRYLSVARYCDDARRLLDFHKFQPIADDVQTNIAFAIDPHILRAYSEPWDPNSHMGFYFLDKEQDALSKVEREQFPVLTYSSVFKMDDVAILNSGRSEISRNLAYFEKTFEHDQKSSQATRLMMIDTLHILYNDFIENRDARLSDKQYLQAAFDRLTQIGGGPLLKQRLRLARLVQLMKKSNFKSPEFAMRNMMSDHLSLTEQLKNFTLLMQMTRDDPALLNEVRKQFFDTYQGFLHAAKLEADSEDDSIIVLREGEKEDINAILETHVLNTCLQIAELPSRLFYVTLSTRMYNFVRRFDENSLRAPLLHPRTALMMHNSQLFQDHQIDLQKVLTTAIASAENIPNDEKISSAELDRFENEFSEPMLAIRNTFLHSIADTNEERSQLIDAFKKALETLDLSVEQRSRADEVFDVLVQRLGKQVETVGQKYSDTSDSLSDDAWVSYEKFARPEAQKKKLIIRAGKNENVRRFGCLPISGSYRHMFMLHSQLLKFPETVQNSFTTESVEDFLEKVGVQAKEVLAASPTEDQGSEARALLLFAQAIFAASNREWSLAEVKATKAHSLLNVSGRFADVDLLRNLNLDASNSENWNLVRIVQFDQEILYLRHFCARAGAEASILPNRRLRWLLTAADDLHASSQYTLNISPLATGVTAGLDPVSIRQALASIALRIEWTISLGGATSHLSMKGLPETDRLDVAWHGLRILCEPMQAIDLGELSKAIEEIVKRISDAYGVIQKSPDKGLHSEEFWRFLLLRAHSIKLLFHVCLDANFLDDLEISFSESDLNTVERLREGHESWVTNLFDGTNPQERYYQTAKSVNPFLSALLAAASISLNARLDDENHWTIDQAANLFTAFGQMDADCNALDPFGFARRIIRAVKVKYAPALSEQLRREYSMH